MISELSDFHIHTAYRPGDDGAPEMTVPFLSEYGKTHGYKQMGMTPHWGTDSTCEILYKIRYDLEQAQTEIPIFLGVESNFIDCGETIALDSVAFSLLDYVVGAADHFNWSDVEKPPKTLTAMIDYQHQKLLNIAKHPWVDVIAHPWTGLMLLTCRGHLPDHPKLTNLSEVPESYFHEFAKAAVAGNKAIEISGAFVCEYPKKLEEPEKYLEELSTFYHILAENGAVFSINSDAHQPSQLDDAEKTRSFLGSIGLSSIPLWHPGYTFKETPCIKL